MRPSLRDHEARISALEADRVPFRAVLSAINALGENQRELALNQREHSQRMDRFERRLDNVDDRLRSLDEGVSELKDLIIRALDR